jgi:hypothetical protein
MVGTGRFELPTPRTPSECSTRLSHVPTKKEEKHRAIKRRCGVISFYHSASAHLRLSMSRIALLIFFQRFFSASWAEWSRRRAR